MMFCWFLTDRRAKVLLAALVCTLIVCTSFSIGSIRKEQIKKLVVYDVTGKKALAFILQRTAYYDFDSALIDNDMLMRYNIRDHWWQCGVEAQQPIDSAGFSHTFPFGKIFSINRKGILFIDQPLTMNITKPDVDVLILSANCRNTITELRQKINFKEVVFDTSDSPGHISRWIDECIKFDIKYHDCHKGAFEMDL